MVLHHSTRQQVHDGILASAAEGAEGHPEMYVSRDGGVIWMTLPVTGRRQWRQCAERHETDAAGIRRQSASDPTHNQDGTLCTHGPARVHSRHLHHEGCGRYFTGPTVIETPDAQRPVIDFGSTGVLGVANEYSGALRHLLHCVF